MRQKLETTAVSDEWATPRAFFAALDQLYGPFDVDVAASDVNHLLARYFTREDDALSDEPWRRRCPLARRAWCNPPYSKPNLELFTARARAEVLAGLELVTCLIPTSTSAAWWHENVERPEGAILSVTSEPSHFLGARTLTRSEGLDVEVLRVRGRLRFDGEGSVSSARFHSAVVTFARPGLLPSLARPNRRGPKPTVTDADAARIARLVANGHSVANACRLAGLSRATWYRHHTRLKEELHAR